MSVKLKSLCLMQNAAMIGARAERSFFANEGWDIDLVSDGKYSVQHIGADEPTIIFTRECTVTLMPKEVPKEDAAKK